MPRMDNQGNNEKKRTGANQGRYGLVPAPALSVTFDWANVNSDILAAAIDYVTQGGDAVSFARSVRGESGSMTILSGGDKLKWYFRDPSEAEHDLVSLVQGQMRSADRVDGPPTR